jgi:hypothetical protein
MTRPDLYTTAGLAHAAADLLTGTRLRLVIWIDSLGIVREPSATTTRPCAG